MAMKSLLIIIFSFFITSALIAQDFALQQLENSPRHHEWVGVEYDGRTVHNFVVYPEVSERAHAVIIIHENRGLTDWVRSFADQVAEAGYIAITPDLLSEFSDDFQRTRDFPNQDAARDALYELDPDQIIADLDAVKNYIRNDAASTDTVVVGGFCWGGTQTFRYATKRSDFAAGLMFYGSAPTEAEEVQNIAVPIYAFYGENDQRINSGIPAIEELMNQFNKTYEYEIYSGAGHGYMRTGDDPNGSEANIAARNASWERIKSILSDL
jgi:carboxymethylenebutenolidase